MFLYVGGYFVIIFEVNLSCITIQSLSLSEIGCKQSNFHLAMACIAAFAAFAIFAMAHAAPVQPFDFPC